MDNSRAADGGAGCAHDPDLDAVFRKAQPAFGREFAALRERRRVSVEEVAAAVGLQPDNWRRVEDGLAPSKTLKRAARRALAQMNGAHVL